MQMRRFIGRDGELKMLEKWGRESASQLVVIFGRRRVGKSTLLTRFCENKYSFFFTGRKGERQRELFERFLKHLAEFHRNPLIARAKVADWQEIFEIIDLGRKGRKLFIVLDEFQWMCSRKSDLISALQEYWDKRWKNDGKIFLVLCGSIVSFVEKNVLSEKSPLYGRRTRSMEVEAFPPNEARLFFPGKNHMEQAEIVMTFGGIPSYLEIVDPRQSLAQNINRLALTRGGYFVDEVQFVLREQLKNPRRYYILLENLSHGPMSREELAGAMGIGNTGALNLYLRTLLDLRLIRLDMPIDKPETSRTQRYAIWDEFLRFHFNFIGPSEEMIRMNDEDWLYDRIVAPKWDGYCGYSFEIFCKKNIRAVVDALGIKDVFRRSGTFWQKRTKRKEGVQIDMVIERTDGATHLIECRWSSGTIGKSIIEEMERQKGLYPNPLNHTLKTALITTHGVTDHVRSSGAIDDIITVKDLLARPEG